jgi:DNA-directed RNA polymerase specialized sigma24 family protein
MNRAAIASVEKSMAGMMSGHILKRPVPASFQENSEVFDNWFSRCYRSLHFVACRVLGSPEGAGLAVWNCWLRASRNPPTFDREGEFRSWLLRILIDEASAILQYRLRSQLGPEHAHL